MEYPVKGFFSENPSDCGVVLAVDRDIVTATNRAIRESFDQKYECVAVFTPSSENSPAYAHYYIDGKYYGFTHA